MYNVILRPILRYGKLVGDSLSPSTYEVFFRDQPGSYTILFFFCNEVIHYLEFLFFGTLKSKKIFGT
jgi:hypothetical protein